MGSATEISTINQKVETNVLRETTSSSLQISAKILRKTALIKNTRRLFSKLNEKHHWRAFKEGGEDGGIKIWFIIWDLSERTSWVACLLKKSNLPIKKW